VVSLNCPLAATRVPEILPAAKTSGWWFRVNGPDAQPNGRSGRRESHGIRRLRLSVRGVWTITEPSLELNSARQQGMSWHGIVR
jgi:hypothetical protein